MMQETFWKCWLHVAPNTCEIAAKFVQENQFPEFSAIRKDEKPGLNIPASNPTFSHCNFANFAHCDFDVSPYMVSLWISTDVDGTLIEDDDEEQKAPSGGHFFWPDYGVAADFGACQGVVFWLWQVQDNWHATALSTTHGDYD
ncbi:hypothetical protein FS749_006800 [Ceratobasidium sp. UAMH 11750]|nr:hypothetical protein FS749_006800 [Ceratobasidium sp. UAMH 11750]